MLAPRGFSAYVRLLHPIVTDTSQGRQLTRWRALAAGVGMTALPRQVQFATLRSRVAGAQSEGPMPGQLPQEDLAVLVEVLGAHTRTPQRCWYCLWDGYGYPEWLAGEASDSAGLFEGFPGLSGRRPSRRRHRDRPAPDPPVAGAAAQAALVRGPLERRYALYAGPIESVFELPAPADFWWPDDRAWCVSADVDLDSTYVGGAGALVADLLGRSGLEALPAELDDPITAVVQPIG
jgi:hypothetical protein